MVNKELYKENCSVGWSFRIENILHSRNIKYVAELCKLKESELCRFKNFGRQSLKEVKVYLSSVGLELGMDVSELPTRVELDAYNEGGENFVYETLEHNKLWETIWNAARELEYHPEFTPYQYTWKYISLMDFMNKVKNIKKTN